MSIECGECERDLRGGHDESCSRHPNNRVDTPERLANRMGATFVQHPRDVLTGVAEAALARWAALPIEQRSEDRPWIMGFNAGWEECEAQSLEGELLAALKGLCSSLSAADEDGLTEFAEPMCRARNAIAASLARGIEAQRAETAGLGSREPGPQDAPND